MKIIFLDYDGVLCNMNTKYRHADPECVKHLNAIIDATHAKIVVSSAWRHDGLKKNRERLKAWGVRGKIVGTTPDLSVQANGVHRSIERGYEIGRWINHGQNPHGLQPYPIEAFVILDDDADMVGLLPRLVRTASLVGLTETDARKAIELLGQPQMLLMA